MKALSLTQPWATLVAIGAKKIETRSWATNYRGPLAIHASKTMTKTQNTALAMSLVMEPFATALEHGDIRQLEQFPIGSILCVVNLVDVAEITTYNAPLEPERSFGDYTPGRYAWIFADARPLVTPIPCTGFHRLWEGPGGVRGLIS